MRLTPASPEGRNRSPALLVIDVRHESRSPDGLASLHGEFAEVISADEAIGRLERR